MNNSHKELVFPVIEAMIQTYGGEATPAKIALYWEAINDLTLDSFKKAVSNVSRNHSGGFPPSPAQFREHAKPDIEMISMKAWMIVQSAKSVPITRAMIFEDPRIHRVIRFMGPRIEFFHQVTNNGHFARKEFCDRYKAFFDQPLDDDDARPIGGDGTKVNIGGEMKERPPARIGCPYVREFKQPRIEVSDDNIPRITEN